MNQLPVYVSHSSCSETYWRDGPLLYTDGVRSMCEENEAYWTLDVVRSYFPQLRNHEFLVVYFDVYDNHTCHFHVRPDSDLPDIVSLSIEFTDLKVSLSMYLIDSVLLMKEEY